MFGRVIGSRLCSPICLQLCHVLLESLHSLSEVRRLLPISCVLYAPPKTPLHVLQWGKISWQFFFSVHFCLHEKHSSLGCLSLKCLTIWMFYRVLLSGFNHMVREITHAKTTLCKQILVLLAASLLHPGVGSCTPAMGAEQLLPSKTWWRGSLPAAGFCAFPGASSIHRSSGDRFCIRIGPTQDLHSQAIPVFPVTPTHWWTEPELISSHSNTLIS